MFQSWFWRKPRSPYGGMSYTARKPSENTRANCSVGNLALEATSPRRVPRTFTMIQSRQLASVT